MACPVLLVLVLLFLSTGILYCLCSVSGRERFWDQHTPIPWLNQEHNVYGRTGIIADIDGRTMILTDENALPVNP